MTNKSNFADRVLRLNGTVHTIIELDVDSNHKSKDEGIKIAKKAKLYAIKTIRVSELKSKDLAGGVKAIIVNGGEAPNGYVIPANQEFVTEVSGMQSIDNLCERKSFFADYGVVADIVKVSNQSEMNRLEAILLDVEAQLNCIKDASVANDNARATFLSDND